MTEKFRSNNLFIAIRGDVEDFILILHYPSKPDGSLFPETEQQINELRDLANSFRPKRRANIEQIRARFADEGEKAFNNFIDAKGKEVFFMECGILFVKLAGLNLSITKNIPKVINMLKPFKQAYENLQIEDGDLKELWKALDEAETGNSINLQKKISEFIEEISQSIK